MERTRLTSSTARNAAVLAITVLLAACQADRTAAPDLAGPRSDGGVLQGKSVLASGFLQRAGRTYPAAVITYDAAMDASDQGSNPGLELWTDASLTTRLERSNDNNGQWDYQIAGAYFSAGRVVVYGTRTGSHGPQPRTWFSSGTSFLTQSPLLPASGAALGFGGDWSGALEGTQIRLRIWDSLGHAYASADFTDRPRELLKVLGTGAGSTTTLYLYRGQDGAVLGLRRAGDGRADLQYWESGCARLVAMTLTSPIVSDRGLGSDQSTAPYGIFGGDWSGTLAGTNLSLRVAGEGWSLTATADFGLGDEVLTPLGSQAGSPRSLYLYRASTNATIALFESGGGAPAMEYWSEGCATSVTLSNSNVLGSTLSAAQFVRVESGSFMRGSENGNYYESPVREVTLTAPFLIQKTEVTQAQWAAVMAGTTLESPSTFGSCGASCPIESVSWQDIGIFLNRLNQQDPGHNYRLPTEAQWEYAARAGSTAAYGGTGDLESMGWWSGNSGGTIRPVAQKSPNAFGLFDMHGNVWELTADLFADDYYSSGPTIDPTGPATGLGRLVRGGAYSFSAASATSFNRGYFQPTDRLPHLGFRLVRDP